LAHHTEAVNPKHSGTKAAARYSRTLEPGEEWVVQLRLAAIVYSHLKEAPFADFEAIVTQRKEEANEFYQSVIPPWMPVNFLIVLALREYHRYYGNTLRVECPTGSGKLMNLDEVADEISRRLSNIFLLNEEGKRAVFGDYRLFNDDPHWRDLIPFHEYFHGDTGRGCGASHQTGWTGLITQILTGLSIGSVMFTNTLESLASDK